MRKRLLSIFLTIIAVFTININVFAGPEGGFILPKSTEITNPDKDTIPGIETKIYRS